MKRLIEEIFPVEAVSASCQREKSIRQGHISTLQAWWARRPLAVCRAAIFLASLPSKVVLLKNKRVRQILSSLYPNLQSIDKQLIHFVSEMSDFGNSNNQTLISAAREIIDCTNPNPSLADTFSGGGSIPLESIRLGLNTYASDLNPIASIGLKLALTYAPGMSTAALERLREDVQSVSELVRTELLSLYPSKDDLAYFWFKTYRCPHCELRAPLFQNKWLSKTGRKQALKIKADQTRGILNLEVFEPSCGPDHIDADTGTVASKAASCIFCRKLTSTDEIMRQGITGLLSEVHYATLTTVDSGRQYTVPTKILNLQVGVDKQNAQRKRSDFIDLNLPLDLNGIRHLWAMQYGIKTVSDLFNPRQYQAVQVMTRAIADHRKVIEATSSSNDELMFRYLGLLMVMNKVAIYSNRHSWWQSNGAFPANIFVRQAISMVWNYVEIPPFSMGAGGWISSSKWVIKAIEHLMPIQGKADVHQRDAADTGIPDHSLDLVVIDPPYFDSITYAYLSDFFYPWTKKLVQDDFPSWFSEETTPKSQELIVDRKHTLAPNPKSASFFTEKMGACLAEARRKLTEDGLIVLMYGHKDLVAWESLFKAVKNAGLRVSVSWPIQTERKSKFQHSRVDALGVSCLLVMKTENPTTKKRPRLIAADKFKRIAVKRMNQLKKKHPELEDDQVALSMSVFPLVLDDYMHYEVLDSAGNPVPIEELLDSVNL
jgi:putative DNA methylase